MAPFEHQKHDLNDVISAARGAAPRNESDRKLTLGRADSGLPVGPSGGGVGARRDPRTTNNPMCSESATRIRRRFADVSRTFRDVSHVSRTFRTFRGRFAVRIGETWMFRTVSQSFRGAYAP